MIAGGNHTAKHAQRAAKSKNLRIFEPSVQIFGAKILRLASLAQDDKTGGLPDKHQFNLHNHIKIFMIVSHRHKNVNLFGFYLR